MTGTDFVAWAFKSMDETVAAPSALGTIAAATIGGIEQRPPSAGEAEQLASAMRACLDVLVPGLRNVATPDGEINGMLAMDSVALDFLAKVGPKGAELASSRKEASRQRWATRESDQNITIPGLRLWTLWIPQGVKDPPPYVRALASAIWLDHIRSENPAPSASPTTADGLASTNAGTAQEITTKFPVLSAVVLRLIIRAFFAKDTELVVVGSELRLVNRRGEALAVVSPDVAGDEYRVRKMVKATRSVLAHRLFRFLVRAGLQAHLSVRHHGHRVVLVEGGLSGLATLLDTNSSKAGTDLRLILNAFMYLKLRLPQDKTQSLLQWTLDLASPGKSSLLKITLDDPLLPDYVNGMPKVLPVEREAKQLVPIPQVLPPLMGGPRSHQAQALLQLLVMEELRSLAEDLSTSGYSWIPWPRWLELASEAGVRPEQLLLLMTHWVKTAPAFLKQHPTATDWFTLSDAYSVELNLIESAGKMSTRGRVRQALSKKNLARKGRTRRPRNVHP